MPTPASALPLASISSSWSVAPEKLIFSTLRLCLAKKPCWSATAMPTWQTELAFQHIFSSRGVAPGRSPGPRLPHGRSGAAQIIERKAGRSPGGRGHRPEWDRKARGSKSQERSAPWVEGVGVTKLLHYWHSYALGAIARAGH